jgi:hypothetical protein
MISCCFEDREKKEASLFPKKEVMVKIAYYFTTQGFPDQVDS